MFFFLAMIHYMVYCAWHYFPPKLNKAWVKAIGSDETSHYVFFTSLFALFGPKHWGRGLALLPVLIIEITHTLWWLSGILALINPWGLRIMQVPFDAILSLAFTDVGSAATRSRNEQWIAFLGRAPLYSCRCEVMVGIMLVLEMATPMRNLMLLFLYWQFLRIRYVVSPVCKQAFKEFDSLCRLLVENRTLQRSLPYISTALKWAYEILSAYMMTLVKKETKKSTGKAKQGERGEGSSKDLIASSKNGGKMSDHLENHLAPVRNHLGQVMHCRPCDPSMPDLVEGDGSSIQSIYSFKQ
jgi:hypothetical protein